MVDETMAPSVSIDSLAAGALDDVSALVAHSPALQSVLSLLHSAPTSSAPDTRRLAACVLLLQACARLHTSQSASSVSKASASGSATSVGAAAHPLHPLLPSLYTLLSKDGFLHRLFSSSSTLPAGSLRTGDAEVPYSLVAALVLRELSAHESVAREAAQAKAETAEPQTSSLAAQCFSRLATATGEHRDALLVILARMAAHNGESTASTWVGLRDLVVQLPSLSVDGSLVQHALCIISWQLPLLLPRVGPAVGSARRHLMEMVPPLARVFEAEKSPAKFDCLRILVDLLLAASINQDDVDEGRLPLPTHVLAMRNGLTALLGSKLSTTNRLLALRLSRLLLQRYGPVFATAPAGTATSADVQYLQLLSAIFTIEFRLALDQFGSTRPEDVSRLESASATLEPLAIECTHIFRAIMDNLVGDDEDVEPKARPLQWWNLPMSIIMMFKQKLDECSEAILLYFAELQSHAAHPRSPALVYACAAALAQWMAEDTETHRDAVNNVLPFLLAITPPSSSDRVSTTASPPSVLSLLLPCLPALSSASASRSTLLRAELLPRLARESVLREVEQGISQQAAWLSADESASSMSEEEREIASAVSRQLCAAIDRVGSACEAMQSLATAATADQLRRLQAIWPQMRDALSACLRVCDQLEKRDDADRDLAAAREAIEAVTKQKRFQK